MLLFAIALNNLVKGNDGWKAFKTPTMIIFYVLILLSATAFTFRFIGLDHTFTSKEFNVQISFLTKSAS